MRCNFRKPDRGFDGFDLAKELSDTSTFAIAPMQKKPGGFRGNLPLARIGQCPPRVHVASDFVDGRSRIVLLLLARKPFAFVEYDFLLRAGLVFLGLRNGVTNLALRLCSMIFCVG